MGACWGGHIPGIRPGIMLIWPIRRNRDQDDRVTALRLTRQHGLIWSRGRHASRPLSRSNLFPHRSLALSPSLPPSLLHLSLPPTLSLASLTHSLSLSQSLSRLLASSLPPSLPPFLSPSPPKLKVSPHQPRCMSRRCRASMVGSSDRSRRSSLSRQHKVVDPDTEKGQRERNRTKHKYRPRTDFASVYFQKQCAML